MEEFIIRTKSLQDNLDVLFFQASDRVDVFFLELIDQILSYISIISYLGPLFWGQSAAPNSQSDLFCYGSGIAISSFEAILGFQSC